MEAAIASGILKIAGDKLISLITSEFVAITGVRKKLLELQDIHGEIGSWLTSVQDLSIENDPRFRWVTKLQDVAYDINDLLFEVHLEAEKYRIGNPSGNHVTTSISWAKRNSFRYRYKVAHKIKAIQVKLAAIAKQRNDMNAIRQSIPASQPMLSRSGENRELSLLTNVEVSEIPTRDREKVSIINKLLEINEGDQGWIVSIVGLGGSGKTTLAKHICHDKTIKEKFKDKIYWVHVSQEPFNEENLIGKVFEAITQEKLNNSTLQHMVDEISRKLTNEKFLLVFDDAWHQDKTDWNKFMVHLKVHALGSKLLLTTRDPIVAKAVKSEHIFNLAYLSHVESWSLFLKNSEWKEEDMSPDFIHLGKEIVNKCGGVPLAIKTLGGILGEKRDINTWRAIDQSDLWTQKDMVGRVFSSLKLSYIHLSDHLKECFAFCSMLPKGYLINKTYLIEQWIANGFIKLTMDKEPHVIGIEYFDLLVKVGFLEETFDIWLYNKLYEMHNLIHDLAQYILHNEVVTPAQKNMIWGCKQKCRYLSLTSFDEKVEKVSFDNVRALYVHNANSSLDKLVKKNPYICSVVLNCLGTQFPLFILKLDYLGYIEICNISCKELPHGISNCRNLQSLHFIFCHGFATLPKSIGKLKKLRNLELRRTDLQSLPQSIGDCRALQSLQIRGCEKFREIPNTIGKNQNLRVLEIVHCKRLQKLAPEVTLISGLEHLNLELTGLVELPRGIGNLKRLEFLNLNGCDYLNCMPLGIAHLTCLKRLDLYVVGPGADDAEISELENLNMISGTLKLNNIPHLLSSSDAEKACLKKKKNIQNLRLIWSNSAIEEELVPNHGVLDALEPPSQIKTLLIHGYRGTHIPCWMSTQIGSSYLESAMLNHTSPARFLCLRELSLYNMPNLKHMRGIVVLPSLQRLYLGEMPNLEEIWTTTCGLGIGDEEVAEQNCFPILNELYIRGCPKLIMEPYFPPSLKKLSLESCNSQLVSRGCSSFHLLGHTSHHPDVDRPSMCNSSFVAATHLDTLSLSEMAMLESDWGFLQHVTRLESLIIGGCREELKELPESIRGLTSLKELDVRRCLNLMVLPEWLGDLCSLQSMSIYCCPMVDNLPRSIGHLTSLTYLRIWDCCNLKQLPDEIEHLTSLVVLWLARCEALTELPKDIGKISTLERLHIESCPTLRSLPSSIQHITSLRYLNIWYCPELSSRYNKEVGDDWHIISHIPHVSVW